MYRFLKSFYLIFLVACGGGGGGGGDPPVSIVNTAPVITSSGTLSILENSSKVVSLSGSDAEGNQLIFSIDDGDDQSFFSITTAGVLSFKTPPDFEVPIDKDTNNVYLLSVQVTDGYLTDNQSLTVTVNDAFEGRVVDAPISGASVFIDLNGNNKQDTGEPNSTTNSNGYFYVDSFTPLSDGTSKIISRGGRDILTGKLLQDLVLLSDVPSDMKKLASITPLTTVLSSVTTAEVKAQVLSALGISVTVESLISSDGWAKAKAADENAKKQQRVNQQVGLLMQTAITLTNNDDSSTDVSISLAKSVAKQISSLAQSQGSIDLTASATIQTALTNAAQEVTPTIVISTTKLTGISNALATINTLISSSTLDPVSTIANQMISAAQNSMQASMANLVSDDITLTDFENEMGVSKLFVNVTVASDAPDNDSDGIADALDVDDDNDSVADNIDIFPLDATETLDTDSDGTGNNADTDDDGDSVADSADAFPLDATETLDTDSDGTGNNADTDDDGDSVADSADAFPLDATETLDTDSDGTGNNADTDDDGDSVADSADAFPLDATETLDTDSDGTGNNADTDDDGDSVADNIDIFPLDATETLDTDSDGTGNNADTDDDGDSVADSADAFPLITLGTRTDTDSDGRPNNCDTACQGIGMTADTDDDGDSVADSADAFPLDATETLDTDSDGTGNNADTDDDGDSVADSADAFPLDATETLDTDSDGTGNNADTDDDGDSVADSADAFPLDATETLDTDSDGTGNNADTDDDGDSVADSADAFPLDATETLDTDSDGTGNNADTDDDGDSVADSADAFPLDATETLDTDSDGTGNNADTDDDGDSVADSADAFPLDATETLDTDSDGTGNNADTDDDGDSVADSADAFPLIALGARTDTDSDGRPNNCDTTCQGLGMTADTDDDGDSVADSADAFPLDATETLDTDSDGTGNNADTDDDGDSVADSADAFPLDATETLDTDSDGTGNNADTDDDGDSVADSADAFPLDATETLDTDSDGTGNNADTDDDGDGVADSADDYPLNANVHTAPTATDAGYNLPLLPKTTNTGSQTLASTSQDSRAVTYAIVANGTSGTSTITNASTGAFTYSTTQTTAANDYFTFKVNDGYVDSATARIDIYLKTDPLYKYQWHLDNTGQNNFATNAGTLGADLNVDGAIADGKTGAGIVVAVVDSGLEITHEDIVDNVVTNGSWNFGNSSTNPVPTDSDGDHGTSVAGIIASTGWNNLGGRGVAPNASIKGFRYSQDDGSYFIADQVKALGAASFSLASDVSVFNMSFGGPGFTLTPTDTALPITSDLNHTVYAQLTAGTSNLRSGKGASYPNSSGNDYNTGSSSSAGIGYYCGNGAAAGSYKISCFDAIFDYLFTSSSIIGVGALDADKVKASYSTPGASLWVSAPGGEYGHTYPAITTVDQSSCSKGYVSSANGYRPNAFNNDLSPHAENLNCNYTSGFNGTSSAAPMVSGVIALMLEANSALTWRDVKHILATTAVQVDSSFSAAAVSGIDYVGWVENSTGLKFHPWYGFGAVDATAAVNAAATYTTGSLGSKLLTSWNNSIESSVTIPDTTLVTQTLTESGAGIIEHVLISTRIAHTNPTELGFRLESPSGTFSTLLNPLTVIGTNYSSSEWIYLPTNAFYGETKVGDWKLHIVDHFAGTTGTRVQWGIQFMHR